jgi:hypothetical protein
VDKTTTEYGLVTTLGQASFVGASGSGLLLGMGLLGRSYGYAIDNLQAIGTLGFGANLRNLISSRETLTDVIARRKLFKFCDAKYLNL